jgi:hypothetical protein
MEKDDKEMASMIFDICGWIGTILVLLAYLLLSTNKIENGRLYQVLNLMAALFMAIGLFPKNAWFSFALQVVWGIVAVIALIRMEKKQRKKIKIIKSLVIKRLQDFLYSREIA